MLSPCHDVASAKAFQVTRVFIEVSVGSPKEARFRQVRQASEFGATEPVSVIMPVFPDWVFVMPGGNCVTGEPYDRAEK